MPPKGTRQINVSLDEPTIAMVELAKTAQLEVNMAAAARKGIQQAITRAARQAEKRGETSPTKAERDAARRQLAESRRLTAVPDEPAAS